MDGDLSLPSVGEIRGHQDINAVSKAILESSFGNVMHMHFGWLFQRSEVDTVTFVHFRIRVRRTARWVQGTNAEGVQLVSY